MPKRKSDYGEVIHVRLNPVEKDALAALCERENVTQSEAIRSLLRAKTGLRLPVASAEKEAINELTAQLIRVGTNLNQAVRAMNEGRVPYDKHLSKALRALIDTIKVVDGNLAEMNRPRWNPRVSQ